MQKQFPTQAEFDKALSARNTTVEQLKADARVDMAIEKMRGSRLAPSRPPTPMRRTSTTRTPTSSRSRVRARQPYPDRDKEADHAGKKKARAKIDAVFKRVKAGDDFAELAKQNSDDGSASQGGDSATSRGTMVPEFDQAAFALKPGEISEVVTTSSATHHQADRAEARLGGALEQVKAQVQQDLTNQKKKERVDGFISREGKKRGSRCWSERRSARCRGGAQARRSRRARDRRPRQRLDAAAGRRKDARVR